MKRALNSTVAALVLGTGLAAGLAPAPAFAVTTTPATTSPTKPCQPASLAAIKAHSAAAVAHRGSTLDALSTKLAARPAVTSSHRTALSALYASDKAGLDAVNAKVQGDSTCKVAHADAQAIVADYRVYLLVVPQSGLTLAADAGTSGASALAGAEPALHKAITLMPAGPSKDQAQALYADLADQVSAAQSNFAGVGDTVLALTPSGYPGNAGTLAAQTAKVTAGGKALGKAASDASQLATLLS